MTEREELLKRVFEIFTPPFKYNSRIQTVTDSKGAMIFNVRGWGHIQKFKDAEKLQDTYGAYFADLINRDWQAATALAVPEGYVVVPTETIRQAVIAGWELSAEGFNNEVCQLKHNDVMKMFDDAANGVIQAEINKLWAVNIPEEPDSEELLFAATSKEHAQSIVSRLHNEIFEIYPTFGEPIADSIYVTEWKEGAEEHAESLTTKWWEHTTFLGCE